MVEFQKKYAVSVLLVSHQIDEILEIADWVCLLENGKLVKDYEEIGKFVDNKLNDDNGKKIIYM